MADLPFDLDPLLAQRLRATVDREGKIPRALEALGPLAGRRVGFIDLPAGQLRDDLQAGSPIVTDLAVGDPFTVDAPDGSLDVLISLWSAFHGVDAAALEEVDRVLAPGGRLLIVHDYGRDDVSALADPSAPQYRLWSRRGGPFLRDGAFRIRVLHCFWTFDSIEDAQEFLAEAFGERGVAAGAALKRPRLSWNVAVYHRWQGGITPEGASADAAAEGASA